MSTRISEKDKLKIDQRGILLDHSLSSSAMIQKLFHLLQQYDPKLSLRGLGKKAGIASSGLVSDIVKGRRPLPSKHAREIAVALGLESDEQQYFCAKLDRDHTDDQIQLGKIDKKLLRIKGRMVRFDQLVDERIPDLFFATEVYSAFGLFKNRPIISQLVSFFGDEKHDQIPRALDFLKKNGLILCALDGRYEIQKPFAHFTTGKDQLFYEKFMSAALQDARRKLGDWYNRRDEALFSSSVVSVDMVQYRKKLPQIKAAILDLIAELESSDADNMVRVNVQIFPFT